MFSWSGSIAAQQDSRRTPTLAPGGRDHRGREESESQIKLLTSCDLACMTCLSPQLLQIRAWMT